MKVFIQILNKTNVEKGSDEYYQILMAYQYSILDHLIAQILKAPFIVMKNSLDIMADARYS